MTGTPLFLPVHSCSLTSLTFLVATHPIPSHLTLIPPSSQLLALDPRQCHCCPAALLALQHVVLPSARYQWPALLQMLAGWFDRGHIYDWGTTDSLCIRVLHAVVGNCSSAEDRKACCQVGGHAWQRQLIMPNPSDGQETTSTCTCLALIRVFFQPLC